MKSHQTSYHCKSCTPQAPQVCSTHTKNRTKISLPLCRYYSIGVFDLLLFLVVVTAASRITRLVVADTVTEPIRMWAFPRIARSRQDRKRISQGHEAQPPGPFRQTVLNLLQCPWCIGFWISTALLAALAFTTGTQMVITGTWWVDLAVASLASSYIIGWLSDQEAP